MEIEMFVKRANGDIDQTVDYPLFTATARETGDQIFLEFNCNGHEIAIPIDAIEKMLKAAKEDVHSEEWFDQNE